MVDLLRHDREEFRREMGQLRPGFDAGEMETLMKEAGLEDARVRALAPDPEAKGPALILGTARRRRPVSVPTANEKMGGVPPLRLKTGDRA
jgi:hypothetical protein